MTGLNCSAVILVIHIPIPSINANKMAPTAADLKAAEGPPLAARTAPVIAPLPIEFQGSSLPRMPIKQQSNVENSPPHTAKLPPRTGALVLTAPMLPYNLEPFGEFLHPFMNEKIPPPIAPIAKAPPQSSTILYGLQK